MEEEIEEKLEEIYKDIIKVKFRDFGIYDIFLTLKGGQVIAIVFNYNSRVNIESNIRNIELKIDNELIKLYKNVYNV